MSFGLVLDAALEAQQACINTGYRFRVIGGVALQRWGEPVNPGSEANSDILDYCPMVTPDGKYLFFSRRRSDPPGGWPNVVEAEVYRVDAVVIERLQPGIGYAH